MINFIHNIQQLNMFRTSVVHLRERYILYVAIWYVTLITTGRIETYQIATYSIRTLLKMDY